MKDRLHVQLIGSTTAAMLMFISSATVLRGDDWGGWMGSGRDGVYRETGIIDEIPAGGLAIKWRKPVSLGYAGPAAVAGRVFVFDYQAESGKAFNDPGQRANLRGQERLTALECGLGRATLAACLRLPLQRLVPGRSALHAHGRWRTCLQLGQRR